MSAFGAQMESGFKGGRGGCLRTEVSDAPGKNNPRAPATARAGPSHPTPYLSPAHSQLLVVLVREVAEPGRVEEELRGVLQQEQDEAQAAQAAETPASLTVPERRPSPGGPLLTPRSSSAPSSLSPHRAQPFTCPVWAGCPRPLPPPWTWLTSQHPSLWPGVGPSTEKVFTASS